MPGATVRDYASENGYTVGAAFDKGMKDKAKEFREGWVEIYKEVQSMKKAR